MKKYVIPVLCFFLIIGGLLFFPIAKRFRINGFYKEFNYIHMLTWNQLDPRYVAAESDQGNVKLTQGNLYYISTALSRVNSLDYHFVKPDLSAYDVVTLYFPDGAEISVYDGGENDSGKDVAYIVNNYDGKETVFSIDGMLTYKRIHDCVSPGGFGNMGENPLITE